MYAGWAPHKIGIDKLDTSKSLNVRLCAQAIFNEQRICDTELDIRKITFTAGACRGELSIHGCPLQTLAMPTRRWTHTAFQPACQGIARPMHNTREVACFRGSGSPYSCGACENNCGHGVSEPPQTLREKTRFRRGVVSTHGAMVSARRKPTLEVVCRGRTASVKTGNISQDRGMGAQVADQLADKRQNNYCHVSLTLFGRQSLSDQPQNPSRLSVLESGRTELLGAFTQAMCD